MKYVDQKQKLEERKERSHGKQSRKRSDYIGRASQKAKLFGQNKYSSFEE
jgi:hypothetical protein